MPFPVAAVIEGGVEVDVSVAQLRKHICQDFKELIVCDTPSRAYIIFIKCLLPVESVGMLLIVEETVVLVDELPKCLEVSLWCVRVFVLVDTSAEGC